MAKKAAKKTPVGDRQAGEVEEVMKDYLVTVEYEVTAKSEEDAVNDPSLAGGRIIFVEEL